ncbi:MAG: hypothetical protein WBD31_23805 [Rubripirellula sp.]
MEDGTGDDRDAINLPDFLKADGKGEPDTKQRHGCLTAWLLLMLVMNAIVVIVYLVNGQAIQTQLHPSAPDWVIPALTIGGILNVVFFLALFSWKRWGFWGLVLTYTFGSVVNLAAGLTIQQVLGSLIGLLILFIVLRIGNDRNGWSQLE